MLLLSIIVHNKQKGVPLQRFLRVFNPTPQGKSEKKNIPATCTMGEGTMKTILTQITIPIWGYKAALHQSFARMRSEECVCHSSWTNRNAWFTYPRSAKLLRKELSGTRFLDSIQNKWRMWARNVLRVVLRRTRAKNIKKLRSRLTAPRPIIWKEPLHTVATHRRTAQLPRISLVET